jgi:class 3 adenylate cyclase
MGASSPTRRLAAIVCMDVAGYSRLMGADEEGTLERLKALRRELLDPKIAEHRGRIVKTTGDGMLVEFQSVVDAVRCAVAVQREMAALNAAAPTDLRVNLLKADRAAARHALAAAGTMTLTTVGHSSVYAFLPLYAIAGGMGSGVG